MRTLENNQAHKQTLQAVKGSSGRSGCGSRCDVQMYHMEVWPMPGRKWLALLDRDMTCLYNAEKS